MDTINSLFALDSQQFDNALKVTLLGLPYR